MIVYRVICIDIRGKPFRKRGEGKRKQDSKKKKGKGGSRFPKSTAFTDMSRQARGEKKERKPVYPPSYLVNSAGLVQFKERRKRLRSTARATARGNA